MSSDDNDLIDAWLSALGRVVEQAAMMELNLRISFCQLVGSKFAAVVAGGQAPEWLIAQCRALADVHWEMSDNDRQAIKDALALCTAANQRRNVLMHGVKTFNRWPGTSTWTTRSRRHTYVPDREEWTIAEIGDVVDELAEAAVKLAAALQNAITSPEEYFVFNALHDEELKRQMGTA